MLRYIVFVFFFVFVLFANIPHDNTYDAEDHRIAKIVEGATTTYLVDTNTPYAQVITESRENGTEIHYTYGNDLINDGRQYFLTDALGSTRGLVDGTETLTDTYDYKPYGEIANHTGTSDNSFLFTGEQFDAETDNYYLRARYYSPNIARFLTRDTYDGRDYAPLTLNHYLYAGGNPIIYVDPSGHFFSMSGLSMSMAISGILNVGFNWNTSQTLSGAAQNFAIGAAEGAAFYALGGMAIRMARFMKSSLYARILMRGFNKKIIPLRHHGNFPISFIYNSAYGEVFVSSGVKNGAVTGAMKHIMARLSKYSKDDPELAKALALQDMGAAIEKGMEEILTGRASFGKKFLVETSMGKWELMMEIQKHGPHKGKIKLFHMLWDRRNNP